MGSTELEHSYSNRNQINKITPVAKSDVPTKENSVFSQDAILFIYLFS